MGTLVSREKKLHTIGPPKRPARNRQIATPANVGDKPAPSSNIQKRKKPT